MSQLAELHASMKLNGVPDPKKATLIYYKTTGAARLDIEIAANGVTPHHKSGMYQYLNMT